jgi:hypothetical protein
MLSTKDFHAPENMHHMCNVCGEAITNPLCPFCLTLEIKAWLTFYPGLSQDLLPKINTYLHRINNTITSYGTRCIKCNEQKAVVCPYCFTEFVFYELKNMNAEQYIIKEFYEFFNFDLDHTGYSKEAEQMEVI